MTAMLQILLFSLISFLTGAAQAGGPVRAQLLFAGDAMQHQAQLDRASELGGGTRWNYDSCFSLIAPEVTRADYAVVNLEVPLAGPEAGYSGYPCFSAPDSFAEALRDAGFDLFLTANNHTLDRRDKGLRRTLSALDSLRVDHIGTYTDRLQRDSLVPFIKDIKGIRFGFLNYTYGTNGIEARDGAEVALIDRDRIAAEMRKTREAGAEILIVTMHWGIEYVLSENREQRSLAQFLVDNGADIIIGGHPHVIQPMKVVRNEKENKDVLVVYSLGNFISNMKTADTRGGAMVRVFVERGPDGKARFSGADYDTLYSAKPHGGKSNFQVIPSRLSNLVPPGEKNHWLIFDRAARRVFDASNVNVPARTDYSDL